MSYDFKLRATYSFSVYPTAIFGTGFNNVKVLANMDPDSASRAGIDINALHAQVYGTIPASVGMPNDPTQYDYVQIQMPSGERTILGLPWIDDSTVQQLTAQRITAIFDNVTAQDIAKIRAMCTLNNYPSVNITISS